MNRIDQIQIDARTKFELFDRSKLYLPWALRRCQVKILMVTDGTGFVQGSFSQSYFGLSALLDALRNQPDHFVNYQVSKAHRQFDTFKPDPVLEPILHARYGPDYEEFRFDMAGFDINEYDQVWLFGVSPNLDPLSEDELEILAQFMEDGGGVFGVGDHATFGAAMCSDVLRVRKMRKWTSGQGVPPGSGTTRHDTLLKGHNTEYTFDDESDDIPMKITPKLYNLNSYLPWLTRKAPHPVLCGRDGIIDILPDHPHEGEVLDTPDIDLIRTYSKGALSVPEFPNHASGGELPEAIAWAHIQSDHTVSDFKGPVNAKQFGCIGTYDGHVEDVGRVLVDSTWHHWMDVNLTGRPVSHLDSFPMDPTNPKTMGFKATPAGLQALSRIENYFQNVALWLSPESKQRCLFVRAVWGCLIRYPLAMELTPKLSILRFGELARDAIGRTAGQCTINQWIFRWFVPILSHQIRLKEFGGAFAPPSDIVETYILGGIVKDMFEYMDKSAKDKDFKVDENKLIEMVDKGALQGLAALQKDIKTGLQGLDKFAEGLDKSMTTVKDRKTFIKSDLRIKDKIMDDVILLDGIGKATQEALKAKGITRLSQISSLTAEQVQTLEKEMSSPGLFEKNELKIQAREILSGMEPRAKVDRDMLKKMRK